MDNPKKKTGTWLALPAGTLVGILASGVLAGLFIFTQKGFGQGDLPALLVWSSPAMILAALVGWLFQRVFKRPIILVIASLLVGAAVGLGWAVFMATLWGPWIGLFSFPIGPCLIAGAMAGSVFASRKGFPQGMRAVGWTGIAAFVGIAAFFLIHTHLNRRFACAETPGCFGRWKRTEMMQWSFKDGGYCGPQIGRNGEREVHLVQNGEDKQILCSNEIADSLQQAANQGKSSIDVVYLSNSAGYCLCSINGVGDK